MPSLPVLLPSLGGLLKNCAAQAVDPDIAPIQRWMNESMERPSWEDVSPYGPATKAYWSQWQRLYLKDGTLVRRYYLNETLSFTPRLSCREFSGKMSCTRCTRGQWVDIRCGATLFRLQNRYYWYKMREDVSLWCSTCTSCAAKARPLKKPQAPMGTVRVGAPMERIAVDLMGPMNETERYNRYILVVQDYFTNGWKRTRCPTTRLSLWHRL